MHGVYQGRKGIKKENDNYIQGQKKQWGPMRNRVPCLEKTFYWLTNLTINQFELLANKVVKTYNFTGLQAGGYIVRRALCLREPAVAFWLMSEPSGAFIQSGALGATGSPWGRAPAGE